MTNNRNREQSKIEVEETAVKPTPAYLKEDYPYQAVGDAITDLDSIEQEGVLYEIKCTKCEMSIRTQGCNIKSTYERLMNGNGCIGCGNKELIIKKVNLEVN